MTARVQVQRSRYESLSYRSILVAVVLALSCLLTPVAVAQRLGSEFQVNTYTTAEQKFATVAAAASGDFVVAWQSNLQDGQEYGVFAQRFSSAGVALAVEFQVNTYTNGTVFFPSVAAGAAGDFIVAWASDLQDGDNLGVFAKRYSSTGAVVASEFQVNTYTANIQWIPRMAPLASGNFVIAWEGVLQDGSSSGILARRVSSAGTPLASELQVNSYTSGAQQNPVVAAGASGDFVVAWMSIFQDGSVRGIFAQRFSSAGTAVASEFQVNTYTQGSQRLPALGAAASGDFVVAWDDASQDGSSEGIFARRFSSAGTALASEFQVNTYTAGQQRYPMLAVGADGDFVVTWESANQDGYSFGIFARSFSSAGVPLASEFQVNTFTHENERYPQVGAAASGNFVVAWHSIRQSGTYGIFAQRFASPKKIDIDGDGAVLALTDGLLVLRSTFTFTGQVLITGAVNLAGCTRCDAATIEAYLKTLN